MALPDIFMQELKSKNDIVDVASSYVSLKRRGRNMVGLCPFHNEKTPSFNIYPDNGSFFCFGCEAGGDVITFIRKIENLDYMESVKFLAQRAGMAVPESGYDDGLSKMRSKILEINRETAKFYHSILNSPQGKPGMNYFLKRGFNPNTIRRFGLGYSPDSRFELVNYLSKLGYSTSEMIAANVAVGTRSGNAMDRFYSRAMFPIIDLRGNVIAFGGRILTDAKPKYINTGDTLVFKKSESLFAINFAKNSCSQQLILAEGYMDVIALNQVGFENTVATLGTALTLSQARLMARYTKEVVLCYDSDEAGQRAASRAVPILRNVGLLVKIITIPGNKDPDDFIKSHGSEGSIRFKKLIESGENDIEYALEKIKRKYNVQSDSGRVNYLREALVVLAEIENDVERDVYAGRLSEETAVDKGTLISQAKNQRMRQYKKRKEKSFREIENAFTFVKDDVNPQKHRYFRAANAEEAIIAHLFANPDAAEYINEKISVESFCTDFNRKVFEILMEKISGESLSNLTLTDISQALSSSEINAVARILAKRSEVPASLEDIDECIRTLKYEKKKVDVDNLENIQTYDIEEYLELLRESKS